MKTRFFAAALLITIFFIGFGSQAEAHPWHGRGYGYFRPHVAVRVGIPAPVVVGGYYGPGYYDPYTYAPAPVVVGGYYGGGYYRRPYYGGGYYRGGYAYRGGYGPRGYAHGGGYGRGGYGRGGYGHGRR